MYDLILILLKLKIVRVYNCNIPILKKFILKKKNFYSQTVVFTIDEIYTGCFGDLRFSIWWVFIIPIILVLKKV